MCCFIAARASIDPQLDSDAAAPIDASNRRPATDRDQFRILKRVDAFLALTGGRGETFNAAADLFQRSFLVSGVFLAVETDQLLFQNL